MPAAVLDQLLDARGGASGLHVDVGGEGRHPGALNVNPSPRATMPHNHGVAIPRWLHGTSQRLPFADGSVARITAENVPLDGRAADEIARVLSPAGIVELESPIRYAQLHHRRVVAAVGATVFSQDVVDGVRLLTRMLR